MPQDRSQNSNPEQVKAGQSQWLELASLTAREAKLEADCALSELPRLAPQLADTAGKAHVKLRFHRLEGRYPAVDGALSATLMVECQRCMRPMAFPVEAQLHLAFVEKEIEGEQVPESHDAALMSEGRVTLAGIVEEELLLSLPFSPMHAQDCSAGVVQESKPPAARPTHRPFADLGDLLKS